MNCSNVCNDKNYLLLHVILSFISQVFLPSGPRSAEDRNVMSHNTYYSYHVTSHHLQTHVEFHNDEGRKVATSLITCCHAYIS